MSRIFSLKSKASPRARLRAIFLAIAPRLGASAIIVGLTIASPVAARAADFGNPPSGEFPILYNDHTVYATPDVLREGRVLAALVKDGQIYIPLRSMFEQMGATVSIANGGKTMTASKPGSSATVTLGKSEVVINGEVRPLDVPPILYHGIILAPVRVISEAMGAYVLWVADRRLVVVRYNPPIAPPTPSPSPVPTAIPTPVPTPAPVVTAPPTPIPTLAPYNGYVEAAFSAAKNYNEFSAGQWCNRSYLVSGAYLLANSPFAVKFDYRQNVYVSSDNLTDTFNNHYTSFSTIDGGTALTPVFLARQSSLDGRLLYRIADPKIYVGLGYLYTSTNYGYPHLTSLGVGLEKLQDLKPGIGFFGSAFYYPNASGTYTINNAASPNSSKSYQQKYQITKYDIGLTLVAKHSPVYLYGGLSAEHYQAKTNAPIGQTHDGPYLGLGVKF